MRSGPRFSNWDVLATGLTTRPTNVRLRGSAHGLLGARRARMLRPLWARILLIAVVSAAVIATVFALQDRFGWTTRAVGAAVSLVAAVSIAVMAAIQFNHVPPPLAGLCSDRSRLVRRMLRRPRPLHADDLQQVARELAQRRRAWEAYLGSKSHMVGKLNIVHFDRWARTLLYASILANCISPVMQRVIEGISPALALFPALLGWFGFFCIYLRIKHVRQLARDTLADATCPDCRYPLREIPSVIDPATTFDVPIGPERCPECGCPWPLIPPVAR